jgi:hypothetical protein
MSGGTNTATAAGLFGPRRPAENKELPMTADIIRPSGGIVKKKTRTIDPGGLYGKESGKALKYKTSKLHKN